MAQSMGIYSLAATSSANQWSAPKFADIIGPLLGPILGLHFCVPQGSLSQIVFNQIFPTEPAILVARDFEFGCCIAGAHVEDPRSHVGGKVLESHPWLTHVLGRCAGDTSPGCTGDTAPRVLEIPWLLRLYWRYSTAVLELPQ